jgi:capsid protein
MTLWDLKDYEEAELIRQKVAACFAAFETDPAGPGTLGGAVNTSKAGSPVDVLEPGLIHKMAPGHTITFATPPQVQGYADFVRMNQRKVASALGVPFNEIASDDSQENFASSRRGYLVFHRLIEVWRWQSCIPQFCDPICSWFLDAATVPLGGPARATMDHTPPRRELISPKEEVPMMRDMVRSGFQSRSETIRTLGYDPDAVEAEIAAENARADAQKLSFDSDGRRPQAGPIVDKETENDRA